MIDQKLCRHLDVPYRIHYKDTDEGGIVYYSRYVEFMEIARAELMRYLGFSYKEILTKYECICPVVRLEVDYKSPAVYDDLLTLRVFLKKVSPLKMHFFYEFYNQEKKLLLEGMTTLGSLDLHSRKPKALPKVFIDFFQSLPE